jgi:hypothetical protein
MKYLIRVSRSASELLTGVAVSSTTFFGLAPAAITESMAVERCAPALRRLCASSTTMSE